MRTQVPTANGPLMSYTACDGWIDWMMRDAGNRMTSMIIRGGMRTSCGSADAHDEGMSLTRHSGGGEDVVVRCCCLSGFLGKLRQCTILIRSMARSTALQTLVRRGQACMGARKSQPRQNIPPWRVTPTIEFCNPPWHDPSPYAGRWSRWQQLAGRLAAVHADPAFFFCPAAYTIQL